MTFYARLDSEGYIVSVAELSEPPDGDFVEVTNQEPLPLAPSAKHRPRVVDGAFAWVTVQQSLDEAQSEAWSRIKADRDTREYGGFEWDGSRFDSDPESQRRIQGAAQLAMIAAAAQQAFSIDWTLADNTLRRLSGPEMIAVGVALGEHVSTQHIIARGLRAAIDAATSPEEVSAVVWPAGASPQNND